MLTRLFRDAYLLKLVESANFPFPLLIGQKKTKAVVCGKLEIRLLEKKDYIDENSAK